MLLEDSFISFVNLDHRGDRLKHMNDQLNKVGIRAVRQRGIPWNETDYLNPNYATMFNRTPGAIGCHLSQVAIMKNALSINCHAWVMEDDILFCDDFHERLKHMDTFLQGVEDWDVMWLGASFHSPAYWHRKGQSGMKPDCSAQLGKDVETTDDPRIVRTYGAYVTFAYIVNVKSIQKILDLFDKHIHTSIGIDWLFIKLQPQLKCFAYVPGSVMQIDNVSDIGQGMTVWSGQLKNGPYVFKPRLTDFDPSTFNFNQ
jgi:GR25 family glycosyltransferase involved in LPS biosynthesis